MIVVIVAAAAVVRRRTAVAAGQQAVQAIAQHGDADIGCQRQSHDPAAKAGGGPMRHGESAVERAGREVRCDWPIVEARAIIVKLAAQWVVLWQAMPALLSYASGASSRSNSVLK